MKKLLFSFLFLTFCMLSMAQLPQRVLVGYTNTPGNIDPTNLSATPQTGYVAVYATANGGKLTGATHTITESFEGYEHMTSTYVASGVANATEISFSLTNFAFKAESGFYNETQSVRFYTKGVSGKIQTTYLVPDIVKISLYYGRKSTSSWGRTLYSIDGITWSNVYYTGTSCDGGACFSIHSEDGTSTYLQNPASTSGAYNMGKQVILFDEPTTAMFKFESSQGSASASTIPYVYIDDIVFTIAERDYVYTNYSTSATASTTTAKKTFQNIPAASLSDAKYSEVQYSTLPAHITLPEAPVQDGKTFLGWKAQLSGATKSDGSDADEDDLLFQPGDSYLLNENVVFKAVYSGACENCFHYNKQ